MSVVQKIFLILFIFLLIDLNHCRRFVGSGNRGHRVTTSRPFGPTTQHRIHSTQRITTERTWGSNTRTTRRHSTAPPSTGWALPSRPGSSGGHQQPQKVKIENNYHYSYPGYVSLPQPSPFQGYYQPSTHYHYTSGDTGSTALGLFLGYTLAKMTTPTFSHSSFFDGYVPRYDHYTVHHYHHGSESVPKQQEISTNTIVGCVGNTATICPGNTISLCTSNGALMCVVSATSTIPCMENGQVNCVKSIISCVDNTAAECKDSKRNSTVISIPCVSNATILGTLDYVNNTIIAKNWTDVGNITRSSTGSDNNTSTTQTPVTTTLEYSTKYPVTITPALATNATAEEKNTARQNFCVTVIALPAKREQTKGEVVLNDVMTIASKFIEKAWGL